MIRLDRGLGDLYAFVTSNKEEEIKGEKNKKNNYDDNSDDDNNNDDDGSSSTASGSSSVDNQDNVDEGIGRIRQEKPDSAHP